MNKVWMVTASEYSKGNLEAGIFLGLFATSELAKKEVEKRHPGIQWRQTGSSEEVEWVGRKELVDGVVFQFSVAQQRIIGVVP